MVAAVAWLASGCSESDGSEGPEPGSDVADADANGDVPDRPDTADVSEDPLAETGEGDTDTDGSGYEPDGSEDVRPEEPEPQCRSNADCPSRQACIEGICVRRCATDFDCNDNNACTSEVCTDGLCAYTAIEVPIADPVGGDCRTMACVDGRLAEVASPTDLPADDGIFCTVEQCSGSFPVYFPNHALCDDGDDLNGYEQCSAAERGCIVGGAPPWVCEEFDPGWGSREVCGDGQDNNNNGLVDENCPCDFGSVQRCFAGPPNARTVGGCLDGYQQCIDRDNPRWSECQGGILPGEEICDAKDNDCNGCIDDIPDCAPLLTCPSEDIARPLRYYPLDATAIFGGIGDEYEWRVIAPPNSATRGVEDPDAANTRVYLDVSGDYQISLTVKDDKGDLYGCSWIVVAAGSGVRVEMRWDTFGSVDMDLHLARRGGAFCGADDCYFANCRTYGSVAWGYAPSPATECEAALGAASCPNPRLDIDNIRGFDPENINLDNPNDGDRFRVMAHMFSGSARTNPVISIYCGGGLNGVFGEAPDLVGLTRAGGGCGGETWRVADVTTRVDSRTGVTTCNIDVLTSSSGGWDVRLNSSAH